MMQHQKNELTSNYALHSIEAFCFTTPTVASAAAFIAFRMSPCNIFNNEIFKDLKTQFDKHKK